MSRLFTFGCSFTSYIWPTWADILGTQYDRYENWGRAAHGNQFIAQRVAECDILNDLNRNDTVVIVWSDHQRFDTFLDWHWHPNRLSTGQQKFWDATSGYYGSLLAIYQTQKLLQAKNVNFYMSCIKPLIWDEHQFYNENHLKEVFATFPEIQALRNVLLGPKWLPGFEGETFPYFFEKNAKAKYKAFVDDPDYLRIQLKNEVIPDEVFVDRHPTPAMHLQWLEAHLLGKIGLSGETFRRQTDIWQAQVRRADRRQQIEELFWEMRPGFTSISR